MQPVDDSKAVAIGFQRRFKVALCLLHAAHLAVADREIALPARIAGSDVARREIIACLAS